MGALRCLACLLPCLLAGCGSPAWRAEPLDELLRLVAQRLQVQQDVARWKWSHDRPIADPQREQELLAALAGRAREAGLDAGVVRRFFTAQIEAGKRIQRAAFERWRRENRGPFPDAVALTELRERIDRLNEGLLLALAGVTLPVDQGKLDRRAAKLVTGEGVDEEVRATALAPLRGP